MSPDNLQLLVAVPMAFFVAVAIVALAGLIVCKR